MVAGLGTALRRACALLATLTAVAVGVTAAPAVALAGEGSYHCGILVYGAIEDKYLSMGAQSGQLRCPVTQEDAAAAGGRWEPFQGGVIYWTSSAGAHVVWGAILDKWKQYGRET